MIEMSTVNFMVYCLGKDPLAIYAKGVFTCGSQNCTYSMTDLRAVAAEVAPENRTGI